MTASPVGTGSSAAEQLDREIQTTLELVDELRQHTRRDELPGAILLRAARACWLVGNTDWAKDFYKRAALTLTEYALDQGRRTGTFEAYAGVAAGAAWASGQRDVLAECGRQLDSACEQMLNSVDLPPEPLIRVGLLLTRMRVAWLREQSVLAREFDIEVARRAAGLDAWSKAAWQAERSIVSYQALSAFITLRTTTPAQMRALPPGQPSPLEIARTALQALDQHLYDERARPPTVNDLVDEERLSFVAALESMSTALPRLRLPVAAGQHRA
ncbi:MAG TPA: hypothetical protein VFX49_20420 [Chloroflexota bacterium]|nr:hypothetical protein [Chloroflexota bacterium]